MGSDAHSFSACEGHLTCKSDVYSYGVVLLEMLSGKRVVDTNRPPAEHNLVKWAKPYLTSKRRVLEVFDARLEGHYPLAAALRVAKLANQCLSVEPKLRPNMNEVVRVLEQIQDSNGIEGSQNELRQISSQDSSNVTKHRRVIANGVCIEKAASDPMPSASHLHA